MSGIVLNSLGHYHMNSQNDWLSEVGAISILSLLMMAGGREAVQAGRQ